MHMHVCTDHSVFHMQDRVSNASFQLHLMGGIMQTANKDSASDGIFSMGHFFDVLLVSQKKCGSWTCATDFLDSAGDCNLMFSGGNDDRHSPLARFGAHASSSKYWTWQQSRNTLSIERKRKRFRLSDVQDV